MIQYASFTGFVRTILIILLVLLFLRVVTRILLPYALKYLAKKSEEHINRKFSEFQQGNTQQQTEPKQSSRKQEKKKVGEYIDFEEID